MGDFLVGVSILFIGYYLGARITNQLRDDESTTTIPKE